jgi:hypothetical protein
MNVDGEGATLPPRAERTEDAPRGAVAIQPTLFPNLFPAVMVGHMIEALRTPEGVTFTICHTHRRERLGISHPCH